MIRTFTPGRLLILAGLLVTGLRLIGPVELSKDQSFQLEAAWRYAQGEGVSVMGGMPADLLANAELIPLTWWPTGYSVVVGTLLSLGLPLVLALKLLYGVTTVIGWGAWSRIVGPLLASSPAAFALERLAVTLVVVTLPVFLTPAWEGTDILLWALVPLVLMCWKAGIATDGRLGWLVAAGVLCGVAVWFRYAAWFLAIWSAAAVASSVLTWKTAARRYLWFGAGFGLVAGVVMLGNVWRTSDSAALPTYVGVAADVSTFVDRLAQIPSRLSAASTVFLGTGFVDDAASKLGTWARTVVGLVTLLVALLLPLGVVGRSRQLREDPTWLAMSWLPLSLLAFLALANLVTGYGPVGDRRYYEPVSAAGVFLTAGLAVRWTEGGRASRILLLTPALWFVFSSAVVYPAWEYLDIRRHGGTVDRILSFKPGRSSPSSTSLDTPYPGHRTFSRFDATILKARGLVAQHPGSKVAVTEGYALFLSEYFAGGRLRPGVDVRGVPWFSDPFWTNAYVSGPATMFFVEVLSSPSTFDQAFSHLAAQRRVVYENRFEKSRIIEVTFDGATRMKAEASR